MTAKQVFDRDRRFVPLHAPMDMERYRFQAQAGITCPADSEKRKERMAVSVDSKEDVNEGLYLEQLNQLRDEITRSMQAIAGNSLQVLEESLWRQEILCVSLQRLLRFIAGGHPDSAAMNRIRSASLDLRRLNHTYASLIEQSKTSCDLMYGLCQSYTEATSRQTSTSIGHPYPLEA